jgi:outer membrane protein, heavy metal efflux system
MRKQTTSSGFFSLLFISIGLCCTPMKAQDTVHLTLQEVIVRMDTSFPALQAYSQQLQAIQLKAQAAGSWMPPTVSVGLDRWGYQPSMLTEESPMNQAGIMISAEQMFPNRSKINARTDAVLAQSNALQYDSAWLRNDLRTKARLYYYQRFIAERKLFILSQNINLLDMLIATAESRYAVNQSELSSIFKAKARRAELTNMQLMFYAQIAESNIGLNTLMDREVNTRFTIDSVIVLFSLTEMADYDSLNTRSDILTMSADIYAMRQEQASMRAATGPEFGIRVSHMQMLGMPNQFSVMGMMVIPIAPWSARMYNAEARAMDFEIRDMELRTQTMQLMAQQMAAERFVMLQSEKQQLNNYDSLIIPAYQRNYDAAFLAYQNNTGNFFVLLDAWDMLLMKKMEAADQLAKVLILQTQYLYELEE